MFLEFQRNVVNEGVGDGDATEKVKFPGIFCTMSCLYRCSGSFVQVKTLMKNVGMNLKKIQPAPEKRFDISKAKDGEVRFFLFFCTFE